MLTLGAMNAIDHHGSEAQKALYLPKMAAGTWTGTMNLTEPQAGSDLAAVRGDGIFETLLVRDGAGCLVEAHLRRLTSSAAMLGLLSRLTSITAPSRPSMTWEQRLITYTPVGIPKR